MKKPFTTTLFTSLLALFLILCTQTKSMAECHAMFGYSQSPNSLLVTFHDSSTSSFEIVTWSWTFGDNHTSDGHNPTHTYAQAGTYEVCLTIHDNHDCNSTVCHNVVVVAIPPGDCMALFTWVQNAGTQTVHFTDGSTSSHVITTWHWEFGDGTTSNDHSPSHYFTVGTHEVCLTIHDNSDCNSTFCTVITVVPENSGDCEALFEYSQTPNTLAIVFSDQSSSSHEITSWAWNFGDGHDSSQHNPTHTYSQPGTYQVCLTIHDNTGCTNTYCHEVIVAPVAPGDCMALFTWIQNAGTQTVHFTDASTSSHDITSWHWEFGDGTSSNDHSPSHYFPVGTYEVCLTIHDNTDCNDTYCTEITVTPENSGDCNAGFAWAQVPGTTQVHFESTSTSGHDITSYMWSFGDNHNGDGQNPYHTYENPGTYVVCLTIHDNSGCTDTYCDSIQVLPLVQGDCMALFTWYQMEGTNTIHFIDSSSSSHDITSWHWDFGDGHTSNDHNITHTYGEAGTYEVCLTIHDNTGCSDTYCTSVTVTPIEAGDCMASFEYSQGENSLDIHFVNTSTSEHEIISRFWTFGDGNSGDGNDPHHVYFHAGTYLVCLTIHDNSGCESTHCDSITVNPVAEGNCEAFFG
ncbi:MAG: PKD domain-containing protein, partial [Saprospiraceae bacterium]